MAYDKADWHYGGDFPEGLPNENGGTHIGMFLAWAICKGLEGDLLRTEAADEIDAVRRRRMTGRQFLFDVCDEKFWEDDLGAEGNAFAKVYYEADTYIKDYEATLAANLPSAYHVNDTWENFDLIAARIDERYAAWKSRRARRWWEIWK